jgi:hypothetical protein
MNAGKEYVVTASVLNIREEAEIADGNELGQLPQGHRVRFVAEADDPKWWRVRATLDDEEVVGFVAHEYLADAAAFAAVPAAQLQLNRAVTRTNKRWPYALNEPGAPTRHAGSANAVAEIAAIIDWLDSQNSDHVRYWPKPHSDTYCNIYAYDYCYLSGVYLPRVWWKRDALRDLQKGKPVVADYGTTVSEQSANALFDWLANWSADFGWTREQDLTKAQQAANEGKVVVMSGKKRNLKKAGHITAIVPEAGAHQALRDQDGKVTVPLQSQAGRNNHRYHHNDWGTNDSWRARGVWVHD